MECWSAAGPCRRPQNCWGVSERHAWRLLAAYRGEGAAALAHGNRGHLPANTTQAATRQQLVRLAQERYGGINHTHLTELLAEREGIVLSRSTVRRVLVGAGQPSPRHRRSPQHRCRRQRMPQEGMLLQLGGLRLYWRQASARLLAPLISSSTTRAFDSGVNLRRTAMLLPSSWTS